MESTTQSSNGLRRRLAIVFTLLLVNFNALGFGAAPPQGQQVHWRFRAFHYPGDTPDEVFSEQPMGKAKAYSFTDLPLILTKPAVVETGGLHFSATKEGLYRIVNLNTK